MENLATHKQQRKITIIPKAEIIQTIFSDCILIKLEINKKMKAKKKDILKLKITTQNSLVTLQIKEMAKLK